MLNDVKRSFHVRWKSSDDLAQDPGFFARVHQASGGNELPFQSGRFYRRENHVSSLPAISYDSNFVFPLTGNTRPTLKNIAARPTRKSQETNRARYAPVNLYANFTEPPLRRMASGKSWESSFHQESYDFRPIVTYWVIRRRSFHVANFDLYRRLR